MKTLPTTWRESRTWKDWSNEQLLVYIAEALPLLDYATAEAVLREYSAYEHEYIFHLNLSFDMC